MQVIPVHIVSAFVPPALDFGGNPAGVVLDADHLDVAEKQRIASEVGLSETAFVSASRVADFKLEFFTRTRQIPHCGHATIAAFSLLWREGRLKKEMSSKETIDGNRDILIEKGLVYMQQTAPRYTEPGNLENPRAKDAVTALGLKTDDLLPGHKPIIVNTGNSFLLVPVADAAAMSRIKPDGEAIIAISKLCQLIGFYVFTLDAKSEGHEASARMFAPLYGIAEESATGMAAGPLACYLYDHCRILKRKMLLEQGHYMDPPSPSQIITALNFKGGKIKDLWVGGIGKTTQVKTIELK